MTAKVDILPLSSLSFPSRQNTAWAREGGRRRARQERGREGEERKISKERKRKGATEGERTRAKEKERVEIQRNGGSDRGREREKEIQCSVAEQCVLGLASVAEGREGGRRRARALRHTAGAKTFQHISRGS